VAVLSVVVELTHNPQLVDSFKSIHAACEWVCDRLDYLVTSRPTAVNLVKSASLLKGLVNKSSQDEGSTIEDVLNAYVVGAEALYQQDMGDNLKIGGYGTEYLTNVTTAEKLVVLTHCNTGYLPG
jgi:methylthioribose-1-phosphate isomerase